MTIALVEACTCQNRFPGRFRKTTFLSVVLSSSLLLGLFASSPAALAQTDDVLVSNTGQSTHSATQDDSNDAAQAFTTGSHASGYKLTGVDVQYFHYGSGSTSTAFTMEVWSESSGNPGTRLATLTAPATQVDGINTYTAPSGGITLHPNTTYFVFYDITAQGSRKMSKRYTESGDEDTGGATGWSIADTTHWHSWSSAPDANWSVTPGALKMAIRGSINQQDDAATLSEFSATDGNDSPVPISLNPAGDTYTVTVDNSVQNVKVTAATSSSVATLAGSLLKAGETSPTTVTMTSGTAATLSGLPVGTSVLTITVTAENGAITVYTVNVERETYADSNWRLSALTLTDGDDNPISLNETFGQQVRVYTADVGATIRNVKVTATTVNTDATLSATLTRYGEDPQAVELDSGSAKALLIAGGTNVLEITVTAANGITQRVYTLTMTIATPPVVTVDPPGPTYHVGPGTDLVLKGMAEDADGGDPSTFTYVWNAQTVPSYTDVTNTVLTNSDQATTTFNTSTMGNYALNLTVTDDEGVSNNKELTVRVVSADATLSALTAAYPPGDPNTLTLTPAFDSATTAYSAEVFESTTSVQVTATVNESNATLSGSLAKAGGTTEAVTMTSGTAVTLSGLEPGNNVLTVTATAHAGNTQSYTVTFKRLALPVLTVDPPGDQTVTPGTDLTLTGSATDPDGGDIVSYAWNAFDPSGTMDNSVLSATDTASTTFNATTTGRWELNLWATDDEGSTENSIVFVTVVSDDATLNALTVTDGAGTGLTLNPADFSPTTLAYRTAVDNSMTSARVTATVAGSGSTLTGSLARAGGTAEAVAMTSGTAVNLTGLTVGANVLTITVTSQSGTTQDYRLTVLRQGPPTASIAGGDRTVAAGENLTLAGSSSDPDGGAVTYAWSAMMGTDDVTTSVFPEGVDMATAVFTTTASTAAGDYAVTLTVTDDENVATSAMVTVTVTEPAESGDSTLSALSAMQGAGMLVLSPAFSSGTTAYAVTLGEDVTSVSVTATTNHGAATLSGSLTQDGVPVGPVAMTSGMTTTLSDLVEGVSVLTIMVTAEDGTTSTYTLSVMVTITVDTVMQSKALKTVLAATGRRTLMSALDNIGSRMGNVAPGPGLTLAGQTVGGSIPGLAGRSCEMDAFTGPDDCGNGVRGLSMSELFGSSAFSLTLGAAEGGAAGSVSPRWSFWGRGDLGSFEGRPGGTRYDGESSTLWLGADARAGTWVAGAAVSLGESEVDYGFGEGSGTDSGRLEMDLTALYPYGRWTLGSGIELRGLVGVGTGEVRRRVDSAGAGEDAALSMWLASTGVRKTLPSFSGLSLAAQGDLSWVRMETDSGPEAIDGLNANGWRMRAGLEGSRQYALTGGALLEPFVEVAGRQDGGDGLSGTGFELAGGVRYRADRLSVEARGRWLAAHSENGAEEQGLSVTARLNPDTGGRGLSFALTPHWGAVAGGAQALWGEELPRVAGNASEDSMEASVDAVLGYGVGMPQNALLTPFVELSVPSDSRNRVLRLGTRYETLRAGRLSLEISGEQRERDSAELDQALRLDLNIRF